MTFTPLDWSILIGFMLISLGIGIYTARSSGKSSAEFFLSGRNMPWWLLGISMVATTFSADTPNLVTNIVRQDGVAGNWVWWAFLLTGMLTVFVYARLWRRSGVLTDLEFYEIRYSGKEAAFLRGFRAIYLGVFFNVVIMASVCLAAIKAGNILLGLSPWQTLLISAIVTVVYSSLGGLKGVLLTDFFQFFLAMVGAIGAAVYILDLPQINGLESLLAVPSVASKTQFLPDFSEPKAWVGLLVIPLAVQWWSVWYPGAEPGGGGYVAQRMLAAKNERHAMGAAFLFNAAHYALRPWPWILVALASLVVYPTLGDLQQAFPNLDPDVIGNDLAYPAMLSFLPPGLLGIVITSLAAAFMSTLSSHLNWGASYVVNDVYQRFVKPKASQEELVWVGRSSTAILMLLAAGMALLLEDALSAFNLLLQIGAGTGLIFILRWFWWRINAYSEVAAMVISFLLAAYFELLHVKLGFEPLDDHVKLILSVGLTTIGWLAVTWLTPPTDMNRLTSFYGLIRPSGPGWNIVRATAAKTGKVLPHPEGNLPRQLLAMVLGCLAIYSALFATGSFLYGEYEQGGILLGITLSCAIFLGRTAVK
ncbi:MAG: sodium:solute symporter family protein [Bacteroidota bacterium]